MGDPDSPVEPLKGAERDRFIYDMHLEEHSSRYIADMPEVQLTHVQVTRIITRIEEAAQGELVDFAKKELLRDIKKLKRLERFGWEALRGTKGRKERTQTFVEKTREKPGEDGDEPQADDKGRLRTVKKNTRSTHWIAAGDPRWSKEIRECIAERHRLLGTYRKPLDELTDEEIEAVRFEQAVYIPGIGFLEPDVIVQLIAQSGQPDLWHALYALAAHQQPHQYLGSGSDDSSP